MSRSLPGPQETLIALIVYVMAAEVYFYCEFRDCPLQMSHVIACSHLLFDIVDDMGFSRL